MALHPYEKRIYSQNGEDGILLKLFEDLGTEMSYFVEIGTEDGRECNTRLLREHGWRGIAFDRHHSDSAIGLHRREVTPENVGELFEEFEVPEHFDLLSIDIDGNDYHVWRAIDRRARVVVVEYNAALDTDDKIMPYNPEPWDGTNYYGASLLALANLGAFKGYTLIGADQQGVNAFFVENSELGRLRLRVPHRIEDLRTRVWSHVPDPHDRSYLSTREVLPEFDASRLESVERPWPDLTGRRGLDPEIHPWVDELFTSHIDPGQVEVILGLGSGDGRGTAALAEHYGEALVFAFECDPELLVLSEDNLRGQSSVEVVPRAVWNHEGEIDFHPVVGGNRFASSCSRALGAYPYEHYEQVKIRVEATRLDTFCESRGIEQVDLLCMNVQGASLAALEGLGDRLADVRWILATLSVAPIYETEALLPEIEAFLEERGFERRAELRLWLDLTAGRWLRQDGVLPDDGLDSWFGVFLFGREDAS